VRKERVCVSGHWENVSEGREPEQWVGVKMIAHVCITDEKWAGVKMIAHVCITDEPVGRGENDSTCVHQMSSEVTVGPGRHSAVTEHGKLRVRASREGLKWGQWVGQQCEIRVS
jgi:hypothetical protein